MYSSIYSWVWYLVEVIGQLHALTNLLPEKVLCIDRVRGCLDSTASVGISKKSRKSQPFPEYGPWILDHPAHSVLTTIRGISNELSWLACLSLSLNETVPDFCVQVTIRELNWKQKSYIGTSYTRAETKYKASVASMLCSAHRNVDKYLRRVEGRAREKEIDRQYDRHSQYLSLLDIHSSWHSMTCQLSLS
jgi:hypothetical protein